MLSALICIKLSKTLIFFLRFLENLSSQNPLQSQCTDFLAFHGKKEWDLCDASDSSTVTATYASVLVLCPFLFMTSCQFDVFCVQ